MSYHQHGKSITVQFPVSGISLNKSSIVFQDLSGKHRQRFSKRSETLSFLKWLLKGNN